MDETPDGFDLLITALVVYILVGLVLIGSVPLGADLGWLGVLLFASVVLAGLVIEALWKVRPWITRASIALAVTMLAEMAVISTGMGVRGARTPPRHRRRAHCDRGVRAHPRGEDPGRPRVGAAVMDPAPPPGFGLLMMGLVVYILAGLLYIASTPPGVDLGWLGVLQVTSVVLAGIVIEALCMVRPWVTRASVALALTILAAAAIPTGLDVRGELGLLLSTAAVLLMIVGYVHDRAQKHFAAPVPVARRP